MHKKNKIEIVEEALAAVFNEGLNGGSRFAEPAEFEEYAKTLLEKLGV